MNYSINWLVVCAVLAGVTWTTFVAWYWIRATWWKSAIGRNIMSLGILLAITLDRAAIFSWINDTRADNPVQTITGILIYIAATIIGVHRIWLVEDAQRHPLIKNRRHDDPK